MSGVPALSAASGEAVVVTTVCEVIQRVLSMQDAGPGQGKVALVIDSSKVTHAVLHGAGTRRLPLRSLYILARACTPQCIAILDNLYVPPCHAMPSRASEAESLAPGMFSLPPTWLLHVSVD